MTLRERAEARAREIVADPDFDKLVDMERMIADALLDSYSRADAAERRADGAITDVMIEAAIEAKTVDRIQGFSIGPNYGPPHIVRDVWRPPAEQEIWRGDNHDEMMHRCDIEDMRLVLTAALRAQPLPTPTEQDGE